MIALEPLFRLGLNSSCFLSLVDTRHHNIADARIGILEGSLNKGMVYTYVYPNFKMSLLDPYIATALRLYVQVQGLDMKPSSNFAAIHIRSMCYLVNTTNPIPRHLPTKDSCVVYGKSNTDVVRINYDAIKMPEEWIQDYSSIAAETSQMQEVPQFLDHHSVIFDDPSKTMTTYKFRRNARIEARFQDLEPPLQTHKGMAPSNDLAVSADKERKYKTNHAVHVAQSLEPIESSNHARIVGSIRMLRTKDWPSHEPSEILLPNEQRVVSQPFAIGDVNSEPSLDQQQLNWSILSQTHAR